MAIIINEVSLFNKLFENAMLGSFAEYIIHLDLHQNSYPPTRISKKRIEKVDLSSVPVNFVLSAYLLTLYNIHKNINFKDGLDVSFQIN